MAGVAAVATVFGAYTMYEAQGEAADRADDAADAEKRMASEEAAAIEAETAENVRRSRDKAAKAEGESRARAAASGATMDGSIGFALDDMSTEHERQIAWMAKAGASRARMAIMGGQMRSDAQEARADMFQAQQWGTVATGAGATYTQGQSAGWWG